jgi:redox-regulated HSP33 family molecular chaperone
MNLVLGAVYLRDSQILLSKNQHEFECACEREKGPNMKSTHSQHYKKE